MSKKKKKPYNPKKAILKNGIYTVKGTKNKSNKTNKNSEIKETKKSEREINNGKKMAEIEKYAKENNITIAQAMIHFM